ncbi:hypothetical protein [Micromonospora ureilytica]|uniref:hypothetical protein n=1 Tax=Micromonospora ureilytica TaxID=709868 RepID=UPI004038FC94
MTTPSGGSTPDDYWRRPDTGDDAVADQPPAAPATTPPTGPTSQPPTGPSNPPPSEHAGPVSTGRPSGGYSGPPPSLPPPAGWRPPVHLQPAPPRQLPPQDMADLDAVEQRSQRVTYGFGAAAGVVLLVLVCLLCSRVIF